MACQRKETLADLVSTNGVRLNKRRAAPTLHSVGVFLSSGQKATGLT